MNNGEPEILVELNQNQKIIVRGQSLSLRRTVEIAVA